LGKPRTFVPNPCWRAEHERTHVLGANRVLAENVQPGVVHLHGGLFRVRGGGEGAVQGVGGWG
jgi:hypothetical protein